MDVRVDETENHTSVLHSSEIINAEYLRLPIRNELERVRVWGGEGKDQLCPPSPLHTLSPAGPLFYLLFVSQ